MPASSAAKEPRRCTTVSPDFTPSRPTVHVTGSSRLDRHRQRQVQRAAMHLKMQRMAGIGGNDGAQIVEFHHPLAVHGIYQVAGLQAGQFGGTARGDLADHRQMHLAPDNDEKIAVNSTIARRKLAIGPAPATMARDATDFSKNASRRAG